MKSHKKTPFHSQLHLAVTIWNIPHLLTRVQALNFSMELRAKCKGDRRGVSMMLGVPLAFQAAGHLTLCDIVEVEISRQTPPAAFQHISLTIKGLNQIGSKLYWNN